YPADRWAEQFCRERLTEMGIEQVRHEPVDVPYWELRAAALDVEAGGERFVVPCFALPFTTPTPGLVVELATCAADPPDTVRGKASLYDVTLLRVPPTFPVLRRIDDAHETAPAAARQAGFCYDPRGTLGQALQVLPFAREIQHVMEPSIAAGAAAFIGVLRGYPGGGCQYYVPYDGVMRAIPGVWIGEADGAYLRTLLAAGNVRVELRVDAAASQILSYNVVGE